MKFRTGSLVVLGAVMLGLVTLGSAMWGRYLAQTGPLTQPAIVVIENGESPRTMARKLAQAGVIQHAEPFVWAVRILGLQNTLKAGEYNFDAGISLRAVVNKLALGDTENRAITIPEGFTVKQILARVEAEQGLSGKIESRPGEGTLFPDTYGFRFGVERQNIIDAMAKRMETELSTAWNSRDANTPLTSPADLLILASIVQKEAASEAEMPEIAGVFINRLNKKMKLQSDPTVIYGAEFDGNLRKKNLTEPHPFNTYVYEGLPPTPISNPGRAALMATAKPQQTDYLYFVASPDRTRHIFAKTYAEHQVNVANYWRAVKQQEAASTRVSSPTNAAKP
jgi:UPF0755 protein